MDNICGYKPELLYGVRVEGGGLLKDFEVLKAGGVTEKIKTNDKFRRAHPQQWLARMVASVLDNVGGHPVYAEFKKGDFKEVPPLVKKLVAADASYILALAHMHTYGTKLDVGKRECPECGRKDIYTVDLSCMKVVNQDKMAEEFRVDLPSGWMRVATDPTKSLPHLGIRWNTYFFRPPTVEDSIIQEKFFTQTNAMDFFMRMLWTGLLRVEQWVDGVKVQEMDKRFQSMEGLDLLDSLDSSDRLVVRKTMVEIPRFETEVTHECSACGEDIVLDLGLNDFFPLV